METYNHLCPQLWKWNEWSINCHQSPQSEWNACVGVLRYANDVVAIDLFSECVGDQGQALRSPYNGCVPGMQLGGCPVCEVTKATPGGNLCSA